jgi:hypothetical protein
VAKIYSVADLVVFPYRARMSSSGALALALQYRKPFISSKFFAENLATAELQKLARQNQIDTNHLQFNLTYSSFAKTFLSNWQDPSLTKKMAVFGRQVSKAHDWQETAGQYLNIISSVKEQSLRTNRLDKVYFSQKLAYSQASTQV